ncbi:uncharacterized membrane-anchored protein [Desulfosporosinus orientis DSM 765]|uniref:Uncharacterized membrane-anchored protein n=1 Tax=Desulfosporosinus orientis (strain ATCC 19365 / DSM 765 / NCIMB 8382 / VKM B-1628 / Singapore I) TaxID=768706 RepID=G7WDD5_DESOD|nr:hypothetical protein [Desulfosporosinus orientis]AET67904.1 uncharacterized membrane-anchored protein [Desulfosporosinus orientis DSM 765]
MEHNGRKPSFSGEVAATKSFGRDMLCKVPEVTIFFWIIKVLCTTVGETFADFLNINLGFGLTLTSIIMGAAFAIVLFIQFRTKKYVPGIYWLTVVLISVFGTLVTDNMVENMNVRLTTSVILFTVLLAATFVGWFLSEKTLSIHSIYTAKREAFYWLAILFTFALGTATGDYVAEELSLGYTLTGFIVLAIIASTFIAWKVFKFDSILTFWIAYVLTRPLGASLGDYLSQPKSLGGLGLGATVTSVIFLSAILLVVLFISVSKIDRILNEKSKAAENRATSKKFIVQIAAMTCVFLAAGAFIGVYASSHNKTIANKNDLTGELAGFISTETDMRGYVVANDFTDARAKADNLEHDWDSQEGTLRPQNQSQWTAIDSTFDQVLTSVRTTTDPAKCKSVIDNSLSVLERTNAGTQNNSPTSTDSSQQIFSQPETSQSSPSASTSVSLGDLSSFIKIEQDTLDLVNKGDLSSAKTRIKDLETAWDDAQSTLQPKDSVKWTQIDGTIDTLLSELRASNPSQSGCKSALEASISAMQK